MPTTIEKRDTFAAISVPIVKTAAKKQWRGCNPSFKVTTHSLNGLMKIFPKLQTGIVDKSKGYVIAYGFNGFYYSSFMQFQDAGSV